jgi:putative transposase
MVGGLVMKPKTTNERRTMTRLTKKMTVNTDTREQLLALLQGDQAMRALLQTTVQEVLEAEMDEALGATKGERTGERRGYRSGHYGRKLTTRVGTLELRVPQDRGGLFRTEVFGRYQRSEKALLLALAEMYVQGVSTRKVRAITEELCGHGFSASVVSSVTVQLDAELESFMRRPLTEEFAYLVLDARYERVREAGVIRSRAVLVAIGIDWEGRRQVLAVELANRESATSWREFLIGLKQRGLSGVHMVVTDDHEGLKKAVAEVLPTALWQRCYVHFLRNCLDHLPRSADRACLQELRWLYDRRDATEARTDLQAWLARWQDKHPKLCAWVEANIEETFAYYRLPQAHHNHLKSTNLLERLNQEFKRRTHLVRLFTDEPCCLRLIRALAVETHEEWIDASRYLNMEPLRELLKKPTPERKAA